MHIDSVHVYDEIFVSKIYETLCYYGRPQKVNISSS